LAVALATGTGAGAQPESDADWPNRIIRFIVSAPAGSAGDTVARIVAQKLVERLGPVVPDRQPRRRGWNDRRRGARAGSA